MSAAISTTAHLLSQGTTCSARTTRAVAARCLRLARAPLLRRSSDSSSSSSRAAPALRRRAAAVPPQASAEVEITVEEDAMEKMEKSIESIKRSFGTVRTGRANAAMLDRIEFDYYGTPTPLRQVAGVSTPDASLLVIQPYDQGAIPAIERALMKSDLGLTPSNDGRVIRLQVPQLTAERRREMAKTVSKLGEEGKVALRNVRRDAMKAVERLEKDGAVSEDRRKDLEAAVQALTDDYVKQVDGLIKAKSDELTKV